MKRIIFILLLALIAGYLPAQSRYQKGYTKKDGTYVQGHRKTKSNKTNRDNYSTKSNTNPYTGKKGSRAKDYSPESYNYGSGKSVKKGSKGGMYYKSDKGKKTYVPKR
ncbi:hypothetical protein [Dysgonomonas termitidis]|uniref:PBCV-specific basic adaptor domain-containing protein n=1 Tax=Dysgonomonas termitidis TaxID=1516126 RepID=A0ABV9L1M2_9BACT